MDIANKYPLYVHVVNTLMGSSVSNILKSDSKFGHEKDPWYNKCSHNLYLHLNKSVKESTPKQLPDSRT